MSASPRPFAGVATAALAIGLIGAPMTAYAEPTATPTPTPSAKQTAAASTHDATSTPSPTSTPSASVSPSGSEPTDKSTPSPTASESADDASPTPSPDSSTTARRVGADAVQAPAADQPGSEQVEAQAEQPETISLTKSASPSRVSRVGQVVTYRFEAVNRGSRALTNVEITDDLEGLSERTCNQPEPADLPRQGDRLICTATLTVTQDWLDFGDIDNSATVFGYIVGDSTAYGDNASAHVTVEQRPSIALDASVSPTGTADAGDRLRYTATATNTGNVTLRGARITSSLDALDLDCHPSARATLSPGERISCTGRYKVTNANARKGRVSNQLTARATGPYDDQQVSDDDTLRTKVTKINSADPGLADTGGPDGALPLGVVGVVALGAGAGLLRRCLRS